MMAGKGNPKGSNGGGGLKLGMKKRVTLQRELEAAQQALQEAQAGRAYEAAEGTRAKLPKEVLSQAMAFFFGLAAQHQPVEGNKQADDKKFEKYLDKAADIAAKLAPYVHQRLASLTISPLPMDLTRLSVQELQQWEQLYAKASVAGGDTGGAHPALTSH